LTSYKKSWTYVSTDETTNIPQEVFDRVRKRIDESVRTKEAELINETFWSRLRQPGPTGKVIDLARSEYRFEAPGVIPASRALVKYVANG
jgi:hypothetical protein